MSVPKRGLVALVLLLCTFAFAADASCPSVTSSYCSARCQTYACSFDSNPWMLCAYVGSDRTTGCMSTVNYSCCDHIQPF
jgi:hypothetical protein